MSSSDTFKNRPVYLLRLPFNLAPLFTGMYVAGLICMLLAAVGAPVWLLVRLFGFGEGALLITILFWLGYLILRVRFPGPKKPYWQGHLAAKWFYLPPAPAGGPRRKAWVRSAETGTVLDQPGFYLLRPGFYVEFVGPDDEAADYFRRVANGEL